MKKIAKARGVENQQSGKDYILALPSFIDAARLKNVKISDAGITKAEMAK